MSCPACNDTGEAWRKPEPWLLEDGSIPRQRYWANGQWVYQETTPTDTKRLLPCACRAGLAKQLAQVTAELQRVRDNNLVLYAIDSRQVALIEDLLPLVDPAQRKLHAAELRQWRKECREWRDELRALAASHDPVEGQP